VAEFGNHCLSQDFSAETLEDGVTDQESPEEARPAGIELDEFPWAALGTGEVEMVGPICHDPFILQTHIRSPYTTSERHPPYLTFDCVSEHLPSGFEFDRIAETFASRMTLPPNLEGDHIVEISSHPDRSYSQIPSPVTNTYVPQYLPSPSLITSQPPEDLNG
jgi:hypothetical protein